MKNERSGTPEGMQDMLKKATTEMLVLFMLRQRPNYIYQLTQEIERLTDKQLKFNTLYLAVYRLEANGHICISEKRAEGSHLRVYYAITPQGETYYQALKQTFVSFTGVIDHLLALDEETCEKGENNV